MTGFLADIIGYKREFIKARKSELSLRELQARAVDSPIPGDFIGALECGRCSLIAEIKTASPSRGLIRADMDSCEVASTYETNGAACISVLTDEKFFLGSLGRLAAVRDIVNIPILRKDFIIDPWQVFESRCAGADAILLIAACLDDAELSGLLECAHNLGLACLVEVHDEKEMERAARLHPRLIGINNRDLATFRTDLAVTEKLAPFAPKEAVLVSESGINGADDVQRMRKAGARSVLVGEALMSALDIGGKVRELVIAGE